MKRKTWKLSAVWSALREYVDPNKIFAVLVLFLITSGLDYKNLGNPFHYGKIRYLFYAFSIVIAYSQAKRTHWSLSIFTGWIFAYWVAQDYQIYGILDITCSLALLFVVAELIKLPKEFIGKCLIWFGTVQAILGICQWQGYYPFFQIVEDGMKNLPLGTIGQQTLLGPLLVGCIAPALWYKKWLPAAIMLACILATQSSMTIGAFVAMFFVYSCYRWGPIKVISTYAILSVLCFVGWKLYPYAEVYNDNYRRDVWRECLHAFKTAPWFGIGPGAWDGVWIPQNIPEGVHGMRPYRMHSEYMEMLVEYGVVGFLFLLASLGAFLRKFRLSWEHAVCVGIMANSLANFPLHLVCTSVVFYIAWCFSMQNEV